MQFASAVETFFTGTANCIQMCRKGKFSKRHYSGSKCPNLTGKFAKCMPEISKIYYKIYREHQNWATEISVAQYKLSRLVSKEPVIFGMDYVKRDIFNFGKYEDAKSFT